MSLLLMAVLAVSEAGCAAKVPSRGLAVLSSAALPGTGQMMLGSRNRGEAILWLDGAAWAFWAFSSWYGSSREQDARLFAVREAGADGSIDDSKYYRALEQYDNAAEYNEDVRREARDRFPDDPESQRHYYDSLCYSGDAAWDWSSDSARFDFWETRKSARSAALRAGFAAGALILNRLVSVIDCAFLCRPGNRQARLEIGPGERMASVEVRYRF